MQHLGRMLPKQRVRTEALHPVCKGGDEGAARASPRLVLLVQHEQSRGQGRAQGRQRQGQIAAAARDKDGRCNAYRKQIRLLANVTPVCAAPAAPTLPSSPSLRAATAAVLVRLGRVVS